MKRLFLTLTILGCTVAGIQAAGPWRNIKSDGRWHLPSNKLRLDQISYVTAHNAFANPAEGFGVYFQQNATVLELLNRGIRGLMLDIHWNKELPEGPRVDLCHGDPNLPGVAGCQGGPLRNGLIKIQNWLNAHPKEFIMINFEDYVGPEASDRVIDSVPGLSKLILKPGDWNPHKYAGKWPTLEWMQKNNKRLLFFSSYGASKYQYHVWHHFVENQYSTVDIKKAGQQRAESSGRGNPSLPRRMLLLNFFREITALPAQRWVDNSADALGNLWIECLHYSRIVPSSRSATFALDFANWDPTDETGSYNGVFRMVDYLNGLQKAEIAPEEELRLKREADATQETRKALSSPEEQRALQDLILGG